MRPSPTPIALRYPWPVHGILAARTPMTTTPHPGQAGIRDFYDEYVDAQERVGTNIRHRTILRNAKAAGLRDGMRVLEIGCGIGTVTALLAGATPRGEVVGVDISPKSIERARRNLASRKNVRFVVSDMNGFAEPKPFDLVVLPDVIEHIPLEQHPALFRTIAAHLAPNGRVLINVPCAEVLDYMHKHHPGTLQVIDQPITPATLVRITDEAGLTLISFNSYGLRFTHGEYNSVVLGHRPKLERTVTRSKWDAIVREVRSRLPW